MSKEIVMTATKQTVREIALEQPTAIRYSNNLESTIAAEAANLSPKHALPKTWELTRS